MVSVVDLEGQLIPIRDAARILAVHANTLRRWSDHGIIEAYRLGTRGDRRFMRDDVLNLLEYLQPPSSSPSLSPLHKHFPG